MMSFCKSGGSSAGSTSSHPGASQCISLFDNEQERAGEAKRSRTDATQTVEAKRIRARNQRKVEDGVDIRSAVSRGCSSEGLPTERVGSRVAASKKYRRHARSDDNKHAGTRIDRESESTRSNIRGAMQRSNRGVVYLAHIPSGFNEPQMLRFFSQFGEVVGVELRRSKKTGQSKGYGYIGFELPEVAQIVAETMNNYMMFGRTLSCQVVASNRVPRRLFKNQGKKYRRLSTRVRAVQQHNKPDNALPSLRQVKRRLEKEKKVAKRLTELGLAHAAPTVIGVISDHTSEQGTGASEGMYGVSDSAESERRDLNTSSRVVRSKEKATRTRKGATKGRRQEGVLHRPVVVKATTGVVGCPRSKNGKKAMASITKEIAG